MSTEAELEAWWANERKALGQLFPHDCAQLVERASLAIEKARQVGSTEIWIEAEAWQARAETSLGRADEAARRQHALIDGGEKLSARQRAALLAALGIALESLGRYVDALDLHHEAHGLYLAEADARGVASTRLSIGVLHSRCNDHAIGLGHYHEALSIFEQLEDHPSVIRVLNNIGINHRHLGNLEASLASFDRAIGLAEQGQMTGFIAILGGNRARTFMELGRLDEAEQHFRSYVDSTHAGRWLQSAIDARIAMIEIAKVRGDLVQVEAWASEALPLLERFPMLDLETRLWQILAEVRESAGDVQGAFQALKRLRTVEARLVEQRANTRLRASTLMSELDAARRLAEEQSRLREELAQAHAALELEAAERRRKAEELYRQSHEDGLTGLPNRRDFEERFAEACRQAETHDQLLCLAIADIDHFKRINDRWGHLAGDQVLVHVASRMQSTCGEAARVSRLGGEEFVLLLPESPLEPARALCEAVREAVARSDISLAGENLAISVSLGLAQWSPGESLKSLLGRADAALYRAKTSGRNRLEVAAAVSTKSC